MRARSRAIVLQIAALWAFLLLPVLARAQSGHPELDHGIALYNDLEYAEAATVLEKALADPALTKGQRVEGYKTLALSYLALNREDDARTAFHRLLEADPTYVLSRTESQKALDIFSEVKQSMPKPVVEEPVRMSQTASPPRPHAGSAVTVSIALVDPNQRVKGVQVRYRSKGQKRFSTVGAEKTGVGRYSATISGAFVAQPGLEYYVVAVDGTGAVLASSGAEAEPAALVVDARPKAGKPIYGRWWFWAGVGGIALASIAAGVALGGGGGATDPDATVDVTVNVTP